MAAGSGDRGRPAGADSRGGACIEDGRSDCLIWPGQFCGMALRQKGFFYFFPMEPPMAFFYHPFPQQ